MKKKIGWQKYEDVIEDQIKSPLLDLLYRRQTPAYELEIEDEDDSDTSFEDSEMSPAIVREIIPVDPKVSEMITLSSNFDCWMGHANFNLTEEIRDCISKIDGVEALKICSRYRFFIGVGKMFDFSTVRDKIQKELLIDNDEQ